MKTIHIKGLLMVIFFVTSQAVFAQAKKEKLNERFNVNKDVEISVDTRYADVIFETWNKNEVSVEAYVEGENVSQALEDWDVSVSGNSNKIHIRSASGYGDATVINIEDIEDLDIDLGPIIGGALSVVEPVMDGIVGPILEGLAGTPLPDEFYGGAGEIKFDHDAYEREGKAYLKRYERQMEERFGPGFDDAMDKWERESQEKWDLVGNLGGALSSLKNIPQWPFGKTSNMNFNDNEYRKNKQAYVDRLNKKYGTDVTVRETDRWLDDMDDWGEDFEDDMEEWGEDFEIKMEGFGEAMEAWGENFGKSMEKAFESWGEDFGESMEAWGEDFGKKMEKWAEEHEGDWEKTTTRDENGNSSTHFSLNIDTEDRKSSRDVKRVIIVKMPKKAALDLNVRYGNVKMVSAYNAKGTISHGSLAAGNIDGGDTSIDVSFSPITVASWNGGTLTANHVKECSIATATDIAITSNSSNVVINRLNGSGMISGSFGELSIPQVSDDFGSLTIILENSDLVLNLPDSPFNFNYSGEHNEFLVPRQLETKSLKNGKTEMVNGYHKSRSTGNVITITAKYSDVVLK